MPEVDFFKTWQVLLAAVTYAIATLGLSYYSSFPGRDWLRARIRHLKSQKAYSDSKTLQALEETDGTVRKLVRTSAVQAGWRFVHSVEDQETMEYPEGEVKNGLESARDRLALLANDEAAQGLVDRLDAVLEEESVTTEHRALLREAQAYRHNLNDSAYEELASLMTKATFLAIVGCALVVLLAEVRDRELYFILGAAGGLMSRLTRIIRERPASNDYGATWSTLILSPISGALAGWIGILLIAALGSEPISFIDDSIPPLIWEEAGNAIGLGLAFLLGFSERFFSTVVDVSEGRFTKRTTERASGRDRSDRGKGKGRKGNKGKKGN